jgi:hypothetical protein
MGPFNDNNFEEMNECVDRFSGYIICGILFITLFIIYAIL